MFYILLMLSRKVNIFLKKLMNGNLTIKFVELCYFAKLRKLDILGNSYPKALSLLWSGCLKQFLSLSLSFFFFWLVLFFVSSYLFVDYVAKVLEFAHTQPSLICF